MYSHVLHEFILHPKVDKMIILMLCVASRGRHTRHTHLHISTKTELNSTTYRNSDPMSVHTHSTKHIMVDPCFKTVAFDFKI